MSDHHRHPYAGCLDQQVGQLHDLLGLGAQLRLLVELLAVEVPVHAEVVIRGSFVCEAIHRLRACPGDGLVGRNPNPREPSLVVERLEDAGERDRAAVRVGDDPVVLERAGAVHLGHNEWDAVRQAERGRFVDDDSPTAHGVRDELARRAGADREEEDVDVAGRKRLGSCFLDDEVAEPLAGRAGRCERAHIRIATSAQQPERDGPDGAGSADDSDPAITVDHGTRVAGGRASNAGATLGGHAIEQPGTGG